MKVKNFFAVLIMFCFVITSFSFAQEAKDKEKWEPSELQKEREKYSEDVRPEENYIAKFRSRDIVERLMKENLNKIYMIKIIISNFPEADWSKDYQNIYENYKRAMSLYYKRDVIFSRVILEKNKQDLNNLFKKIADKFRDDAEKMLDICAETMLTLTLDKKTKSDPNKTEELYANLERLHVAYGQMDSAMISYRDRQFQVSVFHLRIAKTYAIKIMEDVLNKERIESYKESYAKEDYDKYMKLISDKDKFNLPKHKADNLNRVLTKTTTTNTKPKE